MYLESMSNNASDANAGLENVVNDDDLTQVDDGVKHIENSLVGNVLNSSGQYKWMVIMT